MEASAIPYKFATPWGADAGASYITSPIPAVSAGSRSGQDLGFPPINLTQPAAGGVAPWGADFNGFGFYTTSWNQWQQAGAPVVYDATFSSNIGGYPQGARLQSSADANVVWRNAIDNNTTDPDGGSPSSWINDFATEQADAGWQLLPSGTIIQWTSGNLLDATTSTLNFPVAFPNACFLVVGSVGQTINLSANTVGVGAQAISLTQFNASVATANAGSTGCFFIAIGN